MPDGEGTHVAGCRTIKDRTDVVGRAELWLLRNRDDVALRSTFSLMCLRLHLRNVEDRTPFTYVYRTKRSPIVLLECLVQPKTSQVRKISNTCLLLDPGYLDRLKPFALAE
jgi:hypothetical protein